jgi:hypothetical protein
MKVSGGDFEQCCNEQAGADVATMLVAAALRTWQANGVASLWRHPISDGIQAVLAAWFAQSHRQMESGVLGLECQAHGGTAYQSWITSSNVLKNAQESKKQLETAIF